MSALPPTAEIAKPSVRHLSGAARVDIAIAALGPASRTELAQRYGTSRKFIRSLKTRAYRALTEALAPPPDTERVLFYLPVTKAWLYQLALVLLFVCGASYRAVIDVFATCFDTSMSLGTLHRLLLSVAARVRALHANEDLSRIRRGAHDEIFQHSQPVLTGIDLDSGYTYLLHQASSRDAETWALHLWELDDKRLNLDHVIADFGTGLGAGHRLAWGDKPLWADHFHVLQPFGELVRFCEHRAYRALSLLDTMEKKMARAKRKGRGQSHARALGHQRVRAADAVALYDEVNVLCQWMQELLQPAGPDTATRRDMLNFIRLELEKHRSSCAHRIGIVVNILKNHLEPILAFAKDLEQELGALAATHDVPPSWVQALAEAEALRDPQAYWQRQAQLRRSFGDKHRVVQKTVKALLRNVCRASSEVESLNGRLRRRFRLRRTLGTQYLEVLRWFLNHYRQPRSRRPQGSGRSPAERLHDAELPHWLELLGYTLFRRPA